MDWNIPDNERTYLRELAKKQAEYAILPIMAERKRMWYALNDGQAGARPPVIIEPWTFDRDFMPEGILRCASQAGRRIEQQLVRNIRNHELLDDDKVMPDTFDIGFFVDIDLYGGIKVKHHTIKDSQGIETGYNWTHPIKDLKRDLPLLKPAVCTMDMPKTFEYKAFLEDLFGTILPVCICSGTYARSMLTGHVIELMGMEAFFTAMYDMPDEVHQLMRYLSDNSVRIMRWAEQNQLLRVNNTNQTSFGSSFNFTTKLPAAGYQAPAARLCDMWGAANSQETVGVSPAMFHDFCFPYYLDACQPFGLLYYGCCEPAHPFWEDIRRLPHLKKVSISRWCDQKFMSDALRGTDIVFSRKPDPNFLSVDKTLNEEGWAVHIRETLEATRGVFVEFIVRDVYTVHGNLNNPRRCVEIARRQIDKYWHG
jgi:hypothetical protein